MYLLLKRGLQATDFEFEGSIWREGPSLPTLVIELNSFIDIVFLKFTMADFEFTLTTVTKKFDR